MATFAVELVSPEEKLWEGEAEMVVCRSTEGDIAFAAGHEPFLGALGAFPVRIIRGEGQPEIAVAVHGGFVEFSDDRVIVLSDVAELPEQIDVERARAAEARAREALRVDEHDEDAKAALARATVRLEVAGAT